jgi:uncharacterized repeat protein (TIGR03803 family)
MDEVRWLKKGCAFLVLCCTAGAIAGSAQTFATVEVFDATDGANPSDALIQGTDGMLYGTTNQGGSDGSCGPNACGTVFQLFGGIRSFDVTNGGFPFAGLIQASDGNFYGTTEQDGAHGGGTVFKVTPKGKLTTLYDFCTQQNCSDGANPFSGLVQGEDGNLYGTTYEGGDVNCDYPQGCGTVFKITRQGGLTTLHSFAGPDGANPYYAALVQSTDGKFYGTTFLGGASTVCSLGCGTVFKIDAEGALTTLYSFCSQSACTDGENPGAGLVQGTDADFYGTTLSGGDANCLDGGGCGTVFKITSAGRLTTLHEFRLTDGAFPYAGLVQGTDGNFYGTTYEGGVYTCSTGICGTVFRMTPRGDLLTLHSFDLTDGAGPIGGLMQATSGIFYGTTYDGGFLKGKCYGNGSYHGCGTVYSVEMGLGPFISFSPRGYGKDGQIAGILGQQLTGTTSVSFNGTSASFTVISDTFIKATVPAGAKTGYVTVTTPSGTLTSNVPFRVIP